MTSTTSTFPGWPKKRMIVCQRGARMVRHRIVTCRRRVRSKGLQSTYGKGSGLTTFLRLSSSSIRNLHAPYRPVQVVLELMAPYQEVQVLSRFRHRESSLSLVKVGRMRNNSNPYLNSRAAQVIVPGTVWTPRVCYRKSRCYAGTRVRTAQHRHLVGSCCGGTVRSRSYLEADHWSQGIAMKTEGLMSLSCLSLVPCPANRPMDCLPQLPGPLGEIPLPLTTVLVYEEGSRVMWRAAVCGVGALRPMMTGGMVGGCERGLRVWCTWGCRRTGRVRVICFRGAHWMGALRDP